ncbi:MAG: peptidoglycan DD-metalloendopeptidase family protein [Gemmatimonadales bacterium]|nr:peptidoglycan DD-metalloendopeptidase family protein [Gemmatimonadales bacterium]
MTAQGPILEQKSLASTQGIDADFPHSHPLEESHADGGWILVAHEKKHRIGKVAVTSLAVAGLCLMILGVAFFPATKAPIRENGQGGPSEPSLTVAVANLGTFNPLESLSGLPVEQRGPMFRPDEGPVEMRIGRDQSFYEALIARGGAHEDIMTLVRACRSFRNLKSVRTGELFLVHITPDGGLRSLGFDLDEESFVTWMRDGDTYSRRDGTYPVERCLKGVGGSIRNSLYASLQELDAPLALASKMNDILGWDIDFSRDLREGDTFRILYEEVWKEGKLLRTDAILALEIINRGKVRRAYRFISEDDRPGYYDPDGNNMQKQLMRAPLNYSRISSNFSHNRLHPVLKKWMPHLGVDYAAPLGTPVRAAGDGVVVVAGRKKGNGRYVQIRHTNREYETYYLHFSRFAKGISKGSKVTQGQIIGYVGATGYATGPHLDFRVKRSGRFVNPRKLKLPPAAPVSTDQKDRFSAMSGMYDIALDDLAEQSGPIAVAPIALFEPPAWNSVDFAAVNLPEMVRAAD